MADHILDLRACIEQDPAPLDFVLPGFLAGTVGCLASPGGVGKSWWAILAAAAVAGAADIMDLGVKTFGKVLFLAAEDPQALLHHRFHALGRKLSSDARERLYSGLEVHTLAGYGPNLLDEPPRPEDGDSWSWREYLTHHAQDRRLIILDTLRRFHDLEENSSTEMARLMGILEAVAVSSGAAVLYLHHTSKAAALGGQGDAQQAARGSSVLVDNSRWAGYLVGMTSEQAKDYGVKEDRRRYVRSGVSKVNGCAHPEDRWLRRGDGGVLEPAEIEESRGGSHERRAEA